MEQLAQHGSIQKITRFFGERLLSTSEPGAWAGEPSELVEGGAVLTGGAGGTINSKDQTALGMEVPNSPYGEGPVLAVSIAPDSPIAECNLHIGNLGYFRIGVGCPYVAPIGDWRSVRISPAQGVPALFRYNPNNIPTVAQYRAWVVPWECGSLEQYHIGGIDVSIPKVPVKLHLHRGVSASMVQAMQKRSGYHAEMVWRKDATNEPTLIVVTDGRRRIRVHAHRQTIADGGQAASLEIYGIKSFKTTDAITSVYTDSRIDHPSFDQLLVATAIGDNVSVPLAFEYRGAPYFAISCMITGTNGARGIVSVDAWDD